MWEYYNYWEWNILEVESVSENKIGSMISVTTIENLEYWRLYTY